MPPSIELPNKGLGPVRTRRGAAGLPGALCADGPVPGTTTLRLLALSPSHPDSDLDSRHLHVSLALFAVRCAQFSDGGDGRKRVDWLPQRSQGHACRTPLAAPLTGRTPVRKRRALPIRPWPSGPVDRSERGDRLNLLSS